MRVERITYNDYDGTSRTEDFYFNLSKAEMLEMEFSWDGGFQKVIQKIVDTKDQKRLIEIFKMIILKAYGEKSLDGKKFLKTDEQGRSLAQLNFVPTEAYSELFMKLATDDKAASEFIKGIMPKNLDDSLPDKKDEKEESAKVLPGPGSENK